MARKLRLRIFSKNSWQLLVVNYVLIEFKISSRLIRNLHCNITNLEYYIYVQYFCVIFKVSNKYCIILTVNVNDLAILFSN